MPENISTHCSSLSPLALAQGCHTSSESTDGMLAMLSGIGDGLAEVMAHALDFVSLDVEQGVKTYMTIVKVGVA